MVLSRWNLLSQILLSPGLLRVLILTGKLHSLGHRQACLSLSWALWVPGARRYGPYPLGSLVLGSLALANVKNWSEIESSSRGSGNGHVPPRPQLPLRSLPHESSSQGPWRMAETAPCGSSWEAPTALVLSSTCPSSVHGLVVQFSSQFYLSALLLPARTLTGTVPLMERGTGARQFKSYMATGVQQ